ncbi:MAG: heavy-metal-associated domain-containing protein [Akkermansiaceae bacterium]|jgi:copper chaperone CopZ
MKQLLSLTALFAFGGLITAQETPKAAPCPAGECPKACAGTALKLAVTGLENEANTAKAEAALTAMDGVTTCKNCSKSGTFAVNYDPAKVKPAAIEKAITDSGLTVIGQKSNFQIKGMACISCANHLTALIGKTPGVINVNEVNHMTGQASVTFDPKKTDEAIIKAAIETTRYRVVEPPATAALPAGS